MNNQKGIASTLAIVIIVAIGIITIGGVLVYQYYSEAPKEEVETVIDETADWNIYRSEKLGIEFKYPKSYIMMDLLESEEKAILLGDKAFPKPEIAPWYHAPISISTNRNSDKDLIDTLEEKSNSTVEIDGLIANVIDGKYASYSGLPNIYRKKIIIIPERNLTIIISENYRKISDWNEILKTTTKMLSTFKFID